MCREAAVLRLVQLPEFDAARVDAGARALAWNELTAHGRRVCDWQRDFSAAERAEFRAKAAVVLAAADALATANQDA